MLVHVLALVALVLSLIELIRGKFQALLAWAVVLLALALTLPWFRLG